jgi:hypothetical protein
MGPDILASPALRMSPIASSVESEDVKVGKPSIRRGSRAMTETSCAVTWRGRNGSMVPPISACAFLYSDE